ncbi:unnamed protein product [Blepharisma stoltei]|uniref:Uncharacterized protein n=1 Tax=Blepharisma stoltei TaxID=1481888 RepID=A0AAU9K2N1_9CILI|nr:unnamed protein product [Blepharisma stoltei]
MENPWQLIRIARYMYYLEEDDLTYVLKWATRILNFGFPPLIGGWMFKRVYCVVYPGQTFTTRLGFTLMSFALSATSIFAMHLIFYRDQSRFSELIAKYPPETNFKARKRARILRPPKNTTKSQENSNK